MLYRITLPYAVFGIIVSNSTVIQAAPIGRWMIGKGIMGIQRWVLGKRGCL